VFFFDRKALHRSINLDVQMSERDGEMHRNEWKRRFRESIVEQEYIRWSEFFLFMYRKKIF